LTLLNCEDDLLAIADAVQIADFREASRRVLKGPYDLSLVEGSITTPTDAERIQQIRAASKTLVTIGACATAGGIQALRNGKDVTEFVALVYATPDYIDTLATSTAIGDHVRVDFELRGCPIDPAQLREVIRAFLQGRRPQTPASSVCLECKRAGTVCVMVAYGRPAWPGHARGCGALARPTRGCYGCFGPMETPNTTALAAAGGGRSPDQDLGRLFATFNADAPAFRKEAARHG
jgi:coenzyme F420-reducing hydrogenase gamma subunit